MNALQRIDPFARVLGAGRGDAALGALLAPVPDVRGRAALAPYLHAVTGGDIDSSLKLLADNPAHLGRPLLAELTDAVADRLADRVERRLGPQLAPLLSVIGAGRPAANHVIVVEGRRGDSPLVSHGVAHIWPAGLLGSALTGADHEMPVVEAAACGKIFLQSSYRLAYMGEWASASDRIPEQYDPSVTVRCADCAEFADVYAECEPASADWAMGPELSGRFNAQARQACREELLGALADGEPEGAFETAQVRWVHALRDVLAEWGQREEGKHLAALLGREDWGYRQRRLARHEPRDAQRRLVALCDVRLWHGVLDRWVGRQVIAGEPALQSADATLRYVRNSLRRRLANIAEGRPCPPEAGGEPAG